VNAVVFVPTPGAENTSTFFEDSAAFTLDPGTWASVRDTLGTGRPLRVPTTGYFSALSVEWTRTPNDGVPAVAAPAQ
jgi:hypothetical protein